MLYARCESTWRARDDQGADGTAAGTRIPWHALTADETIERLGHWTDAAVILAVVVLNAIVGFWQEGQPESALAAVRTMLSPDASVLRDGRRRTVPAAGLVPGDIAILEAGDRAPADLRLVEVRGLRVQEAAPVPRDAGLGDRSSMAFSGTLVTAGRGVVAETGAGAEIGRPAHDDAQRHAVRPRRPPVSLADGAVVTDIGGALLAILEVGSSFAAHSGADPTRRGPRWLRA